MLRGDEGRPWRCFRSVTIRCRKSTSPSTLTCPSRHSLGAMGFVAICTSTPSTTTLSVFRERVPCVVEAFSSQLRSTAQRPQKCVRYFSLWVRWKAACGHLIFFFFSRQFGCWSSNCNSRMFTSDDRYMSGTSITVAESSVEVLAQQTASKSSVELCKTDVLTMTCGTNFDRGLVFFAAGTERDWSPHKDARNEGCFGEALDVDFSWLADPATAMSLSRLLRPF